MFILVIALMVFGPRRLPEIAGKLGRYVAQLRSLSDGLMAEWQREINAAAQLEELEKARQDIQEIKKDFSKTSSELRQVRKDIDQEAKSIVPPIQPRTGPSTASVSPPLASEPEPSSSPAEGNQPDETETSAEAPAVELPQQNPENSIATTQGDAFAPSQQTPPSTNGSASIIPPKSQEVLGD
ncbi:MAG: twin-arginine translocase TatA/TatE family subunit [Anaerolineales bacterium]|nr:twin-arginine translocase TatA/TatE family subunit [Anaerolineales bacterium]